MFSFATVTLSRVLSTVSTSCIVKNRKLFTVVSSTGFALATKLISENQIDGASLIDCRSDTVTKPDDEMRLAMMNAVVGDDVYQEDPTVNELQSLAAEMLGKEAALFVPSGTMSNLIALLVHCKGRGSEAIVGDQSHILHYEQNGAAQFGGINLRAVKTFPDGTINLAEVADNIRDQIDVHQPITTLLCLENTHNLCGGRIVPMEFIHKTSQLAKERNLKYHLDGARIFNAAVSLGVPVSEIAAPFDSISICLSKGLGAPVGSLIVGTNEFIAEALRCRKALGGGMRQAGIIAAAGIVALKKGPKRLEQDHAFTKLLAVTAKEAGEGIVDVDLDTVETNMVMLKARPDSGLTTAELVFRLSRSTEEELRELKNRDVRMLCYPMTAANAVRIVVHCDLTKKGVELVQLKLRYVLSEARKQKMNSGH